MRSLSSLGRLPSDWIGAAALTVLAFPSFLQLVLAQQSAGPLRLAQAQALPHPALPEAPPAHPPAAPCGGCSEGCGGGSGGLRDVYLHSGEFHLEEVDLVIPGRGLDFQWARTYRSRIGPSSAQGHGWDFSYNLRIEGGAAGVHVMDGNGRSDLYSLQANGTYAAEQFFREGRFNPDGTFTLLFADQGTWTFFALDGSPLAGKVKEIADRNGNTLGFDYDGFGRLNLVVDTLGREIHVAYDAAGRIASVTDFLGRQVVYQYYGTGQPGGSQGDLKSARSPVVVGTPNGNNFVAGKTTTYTYSKGFADERLNHNLLSVTDPKGQTWLVNEYAAVQDPSDLRFDRLLRQTRGHPGDVIDVTYAMVGTQGAPSLLAIVNDAVGNVSEYRYDLLGRCLVRRDFTGRADPDLPTTRTTNRPTNPLRPSDPAFFETRWSYNADSRATEVVHPNGNVTQNVYELELDPLAAPRSRGNLRERHGLPGTHVPAGDQIALVELFEYDSGFGGCCGSNFVRLHTDARGNVTEHVYDASGNRIQTRQRIPSIVEDFTYNAFGQMTSHTHPDNGKGWRQTDTWTYYAPPSFQNGYLQTEVLDANGLALTTTWVNDAVGNALQVTDARGNVTTMVVNALDQVVRQTSPPVQMLNGAPVQYVQYAVDTWFDANDNVVRVDTQNFDDQGLLSSNPYLTTSFEYGILDREIREIEEVDAARNVVTEYEYDANGNRTLVRHGQATNGAQPTNVERLLFDERNLPFRKIRAEGDPNQSSAQHDYDGNGNLVQITGGLEAAMPRIRTSTIDAYGRVVLELDPMGNVTTRNYDPNGNLVHERVDGELCDVAGSAGNVRLMEASHVYDAMDRLVRSDVQHFDPATQAPLGDGLSRTDWTYTDRSEVATVRDDRGSETGLCYDTAGRLEFETDDVGNSFRNIYDANGNVVQLVETEVQSAGGPNLSFTSTRLYDAIDRLTLSQDSAGNEVLIGYDSRDNVTRVVDALGNLTTQTYDGLDRLLSSTRLLRSDGTGNGTVVGQILRWWSWDDSSRLVGQTDANNYVTSYAYDALGRRQRTTFADGSMEILTFDAHDNVVTRVDPNGTLVASTYDLGNRLSSRAIAPGAGVSAATTFEVWKHDGLARLVHAQDDDSLVTRAYDSLSNQTREIQDGKTLASTHDGMRNVLSLTYPSGKLVSYTYDALSRVRAVSSSTNVATYDYVGPWRVQRRSGGGGIGIPVRTSLYGYDAARRMISVLHTAGEVALDRRTFQWDAMYNKTRSTDVLTGTVQDFTYDSQYRLVRSKETAAGGAVVRDVSFAFDGVGNRTSVVGGSFPGTYTMSPTVPEPADRPMNQYTGTPATGGVAYDRNGNQIARGSSETLAYDYRNQLVLHSGPAGTTSFAYDALGRNTAKVLPSSADTVRYSYHGMDVVEERDGNHQVLASYVRGRFNAGFDNQQGWVGFNPQPEPPIGREILARDAQSQRLYFLGDDLGSTRAVANSAGTVVERYRYDEAGLPSFFTGGGGPLTGSAIENAWLFTGQRWDDETRFSYYNSRFMDPLLGQFLSRDPLGVWGDAVNLGNARTYVANNFQTLVDPTGMYAARTACGGPWPGPRNVYYRREDCGLNSALPDALCRAMRAAGQARRTARNWVSFELNGYPGGTSWLTGAVFLEWFGGPDGFISPVSRGVISTAIWHVWKPFRNGQEIGIECESSCGNENAYVPWYDSNLHLCPVWWTRSARLRASILLHEMAHEYAGLGPDHFYHAQQTNPSTINLSGFALPNLFETSVLATNADTYEGFYLKYFVR